MCAGPPVEDVCSKAFSLVIMLQLCNGKEGHAGWVKNPYSLNTVSYLLETFLSFLHQTFLSFWHQFC
jgi:hypothetical protein